MDNFSNKRIIFWNRWLSVLTFLATILIGTISPFENELISFFLHRSQLIPLVSEHNNPSSPLRHRVRTAVLHLVVEKNRYKVSLSSFLKPLQSEMLLSDSSSFS